MAGAYQNYANKRLGIFPAESTPTIAEIDEAFQRAQVALSQANAQIPPTTIDDTLETRGSRYGEFKGHATISQGLKRELRAGNWEKLQPDQKECLEMIAHKIARVLNGDPDYADSWHDIVGYARLVEKRLEGEARKK